MCDQDVLRGQIPWARRGAQICIILECNRTWGPPGAISPQRIDDFANQTPIYGFFKVLTNCSKYLPLDLNRLYKEFIKGLGKALDSSGLAKARKMFMWVSARRVSRSPSRLRRYGTLLQFLTSYYQCWEISQPIASRKIESQLDRGVSLHESSVERVPHLSMVMA